MKTGVLWLLVASCVLCLANAFEFYRESMPKKISAGQWIFKENAVASRKTEPQSEPTTSTTTKTTSTTTRTTSTTTRTTTATTTTTTATTSGPTTTLSSSLRLVETGLDARREIASYNAFMDAIFLRMNDALRAKQLDPMLLKVVQNNNDDFDKKVSKVKGYLYGMSTLQRKGDVSIFVSDQQRTVRCPFALGPLRLKVARTTSVQEKETKSATAATELMLGLMDLRVDVATGQVEVTDVVFDEPGSVDVSGSLRKRANSVGDEEKKTNSNSDSPYKLVLTPETSASIQKMARLVMQPSLSVEA